MHSFTHKIADYSRARLLLLCSELQAKLTAQDDAKSEPIAIVGIGCRFPGGANDLKSYWELLRNGVDAITEIPRDRWDVEGNYDADPNVPGKMYCKQGGFLDQVDGFDPEFFNISPREAISLDPQQRLLLEVVWEALENAGQDPTALNGSRTGVFVGIGTDDYAKIQVRDLDAKDVSVYSGTGNAYCYAAGRISYILGLHGPCLPIDTACSSSLVAIHLACQSLRSGECDAALAGGVQLILAPFAPIFLSKARALAPDGHAKTFDEHADGFCRGEGSGVLVLKRLSDAIAAGDRIHAVIPGSAVNHDGRSSSFTVPNGLAQQEVIRTALANGKIDPLDVGYVEAHGTGTSLGDPIEVRALAAVYGKAAGRSNDPLAVGSVKTNFGHLESAAGIAGLIKIILSMQNGVIPPHLNFQRVNPHIALSEGPFVIPTECLPWAKPQGARIAAVSSFGLSGTNAHVLIRDRPQEAVATRDAARPERPLHVFTLSAKTETALKELAQRYVDVLDQFPARTVADVCYTANAGRAHFAHRLAIVASTTRQLKRQLAAFVAGVEDKPASRVLASKTRAKVVFLFTGQGSQYVGMGRELYQSQPAFREVLDTCDRLCQPLLGKSLLSIMFEDEALLNDTTYQQPALFALEYALAQLWRSWGVEPAAVIGHSVGEVVAACVAGLFSLEDGLKLVTARARLMGSLPHDGDMVAVLADEARVARAIAPYASDISIAGLNAPDSVVISGRIQAIAPVAEALRSEGIETRSLSVSHAFHSPLMEPILAEFEQAIAGISFQRPQIKLISNVTGKLAGDEIKSAQYWSRHIREPVRFAAGMKTLHEQGFGVFLEMGPKAVLTGLGKRCLPRDSGAHWLTSIEPAGEWQALSKSVAQLYLLGAALDWRGFDRGYSRQVLTLPTYAFQRQRYWVELTRPVSEPFFALESEARKDPELRSLIDHLLGAWGEDGAQAINRRMTAPILFFPPAMKSFFYVARRDRSLAILDYVGPDESFESSLNVLADVARSREWSLTMLAPPRRVASLRRLGWSTTPIGVWQALHDLKTFSLDGPDRKRLRSKVNSYRNLGDCSTTPYRIGTDLVVDKEILQMIDEWVERKGKRAPFVTMLKREIAEGTLDKRYRLYLTQHQGRLEAVVLLSPCGRNRGYLMDLEFYRLDMKAGCLEFSITEIISQLRREGFNYFSIGSTFGTQLGRHEGQNDEVEALLRAFYDQNILNSDSNFSFKKKFSPEVLPSYICRPEPSDISDVPEVLRLLADPEPNPSIEGWDIPKTAGRPGRVQSGVSSSTGDSSGRNPLLGQRLPLAVRDLVFESHLDLNRPSLEFLRDHQVFGQTILPGTGYLECALSGMDSVVQGGVGALRDVVIQQPLGFAGEAVPRMQLVLSPSGPNEFAFRISSAVASGSADSDGLAWTEHVTGKVVRGHESRTPLAPIPLEDIRQECRDELPVEGYYDEVRSFGMEFGSRFRGLKQAWRGENQALGLVRLPEAIEAEAATYRAHPALLDACLHVQSAFLLSLRNDESATYLPVGIERIEVRKPLGSEVWSHVRLRKPKDGNLETLIADFRIYDGAGELLAEIEGFLAKRTSREAIEFLMQSQRGDLDNLAYEVRWRPQNERKAPAAQAEQGYWLAFSDAGGLGDRLAALFGQEGPQTPCFRVLSGTGYERGEDGTWVVDPSKPEHFERLLSEVSAHSGLPCAGIVHLWGSEAPQALDRASLWDAQILGCGSTLHVLQALVKAQQSALVAARCPLWLVTRGVQVVDETPSGGSPPWQAPLWGLGRSIAQEHPELWGGLIDLDQDPGVEDARRVFAEIHASDGEDNLAFRGNDRYAARLVARTNKERRRDASPLCLDANATHLITGGLGGLGLTLARWMVERGARHIAFASRARTLSSDASEAIAQLEQAGAKVRVLRADVSQSSDVAAMLREITETMPPLAGVVHAAGVLADGTLLQQSWSRFEEVMAAKLEGAWNLHVQTQGMDLQYFVCFSSIASLLGTAGQANYAAANAFMDGLARYRRAQGLPALSIHWGPWAEVGMAARISSRAAEQRASHGIGALSPSQGLRVFESLLAEQLRQEARISEVGVISVNWERLVSSALQSLANGSLLRDLSRAKVALKGPRGKSAVLASVLEAEGPQRPGIISDFLAKLVAGIAKLDNVDTSKPLTEMGFDSLMALEFRERIEGDLDVKVPIMALFRGDSIVDFAAFLLVELTKKHPHLADPSGLTGRESAEELLAKLDQLDDKMVESLLKGMASAHVAQEV